MRLTQKALRRQNQSGGTVGRILIPIVVGILLVIAQQYELLPFLTTWFGASAGAVAFALGAAIGSVIVTYALPASGGFDGQLSRPQDFAIPQSTEGVPIPYVAGTIKLAGSYLWYTNFRSEDVKADSGDSGKGGGGGGGDQVVGHNYFVTFAYALCLGKVDMLKAIWADEKLIFGASVSEVNEGPGGLTLGTKYFNKGPGTVIYDTLNYYGTFLDFLCRFPPGTSFTVDPLYPTKNFYWIEGTQYFGCLLASFLPRRLEQGYYDPHNPTDHVNRLKAGRKYFVWSPPNITYVKFNGTDYHHLSIFTPTAPQVAAGIYQIYPVSNESPLLVLEDNPSGTLVIGRKYMVFQSTGTFIISHGNIEYGDGKYFIASSTSYSVVSGTGIVAIEIAFGTNLTDDTMLLNRGYQLAPRKLTYRGTVYPSGSMFLGRAGVVTYETEPVPTALVVQEGKVITTGGDYSDFSIDTRACRIYWGKPEQNAPDSTFLPAPFTPSQNLRYGGICYIIFKDFALKGFTHIPRIAVEIQRVDAVFEQVAAIPGAPDFSALNTSESDVNPVVSTYEILTDSRLGVGLTSADLDGTSFLEAANMVDSEGFALTIYLQGQQTARGFFTDLSKYIDAIAYFNGSKIALKLLRGDYLETVGSGNLVPGTTYVVYGSGTVTYDGVVYSPYQSFLCLPGILGYSVTGSPKVLKILVLDYSRIVGQLQVSRATLSTLPTEISFSCLNRANQYKTQIQGIRINAIFEETGNPAPEVVQYPWILVPDLIGKLMSRTVRRKCQALASASITAPSEMIIAEPGDVLLIHDVTFQDGSTEDMFFRVGKATHRDDETVILELVEDPYGSFVDFDAGSIENTAPNPSNTPPALSGQFYGYEVPYEFVHGSSGVSEPNEPILVVFACRTNALQSGYFVFSSVNGSDYTNRGRTSYFALRGFLDEGYGITPEVDVSGTLLVDFTGMLASDIASLASLTSLAFADQLTGRISLIIGGEILFVLSGSVVSGNIWKFHVIRNRCGTARVPHDLGAEVFLLQTSNSVRSGVALDALDPGYIVDFKALASNGSSTENTNSVVPKTLAISGIASMGIVPENVVIEGKRSVYTYPPSIGNHLAISWTPRFRKQGAGFAANSLSSLSYPIDFAAAPECKFEIDLVIDGATKRTINSSASSYGSVISGYSSAVLALHDLYNDSGFAFPKKFVLRIKTISLQPGYQGLVGFEYQEVEVYRS